MNTKKTETIFDLKNYFELNFPDSGVSTWTVTKQGFMLLPIPYHVSYNKPKSLRLAKLEELFDPGIGLAYSSLLLFVKHPNSSLKITGRFSHQISRGKRDVWEAISLHPNSSIKEVMALIDAGRLFVYDKTVRLTPPNSQANLQFFK